MGLFNALKFSRLKENLAKTRDSLFGKIQKAVTGKSKIDDELIEELEEILLAADVGMETTTEIITQLRARIKSESFTDPAELRTLLGEEIRNAFTNGASGNVLPLDPDATKKPHVILVVGVNGVGKTTTIGKLAYNYKSAGMKVIIAAADTFRAAANEQLEIWAARAGVEIVQAGQSVQNADPAAVAFDALKAAIARSADVIIVDTAGRIHTRSNLMEELKKIKRVLQKVSPEAPHEVLLVLDASIGQNALQQAKQFDEAIGITGLVLAKLDGTAKGGIILAINKELNIPVKYIGIGEQIGDLQPFDRTLFVDALFENQ